MTKDQIIAMAREAGMNLDASYSIYVGSEINLERFASLVAAQAAAEEREECAIEASSWKRSKLLLHAGEMTAQERRSCEAVSSGIAAAIRGRKSP